MPEILVTLIATGSLILGFCLGAVIVLMRKG